MDSIKNAGLRLIAKAADKVAHMNAPSEFSNPWCFAWTYDPEMPECLKHPKVSDTEPTE